MQSRRNDHLLSGHRAWSGGSCEIGYEVRRKVLGDRSERKFSPFMQPKEVTTKVERVDITHPSIDPSNASVDSCDPFTDSADDGCEDAFAYNVVIDQELDLPTDQGFLIFGQSETFAKSRYGQFDFIQLFSLFGRQLVSLRIDDRVTDHLHDGFGQFGIETLRVEFRQFSDFRNDRVDQ
jgi:hypothetical protein